eukprot:CAMPEP_0197938926 /NCGR_PEP_ID=MMETSP1439-20131203/118952_1 /TAXON_ID=66791 /ORGANISM="Gonyaulax spinifera, Strain CCMP409" /LENGTH=49 /DNA_ID= /DNA_START= /DNA_END= /DNA_ORIENTATION=
MPLASGDSRPPALPSRLCLFLSAAEEEDPPDLLGPEAPGAAAGDHNLPD